MAVNTGVRRVFVEKKPGYNGEAREMYFDLVENLGVTELKNLRLINRYDISGITDQEYVKARNLIFSEPPVDIVYDEVLSVNTGEYIFAIEYLPGQYDQRADSTSQCIQMLTQGEAPIVKTAKVIILEGDVSAAQFQQIKDYCINPVDSRAAQLEKPCSLNTEIDVPADVPILTGFMKKSMAELTVMMDEMGLAMTLADLAFCQAYFRDEERRDPSLTELKVIDTYWSDHCRHTTFLTQITDVTISNNVYTKKIEEAYQSYLASRSYVYGDRLKDISLMDLAVIGMKELRKRGKLADLDVSEEINACSIIVDVDVDGENQEWLVMFKNETHNHPTEIEPFGGAATCLGGAIRDPLSGRSYVYQAMRVTGSGDPRIPVEQTLPGKLPQRKITTGAAAGYSSYGNQIGLATGQVVEIYDPGYVAKRMEIGAVIGAAPRSNVVRETPIAGDIIVLLGGKTGRDGCGGATGSSKEHTEDSIHTCGAEVQKGNPPTERKIQRLFRNPSVSQMIKRCNDFGAGGVCVAIGELADGLRIDLDAVPKKYDGLDGTELAISESQERMAVVIRSENVDDFTALVAAENLEATVVAVVTSQNRMELTWRDQTIVDLSRDFLNTNGAKQVTKAMIAAPALETYFDKVDTATTWITNLQRLNVCSQRGLVELFDSSIGAATVLMPFGGIYQATPVEAMVAKIPVLAGETNTATAMSFGYNPELATWSPFHGAVYAIVEALAKVVAVGGDYTKTRLTLQEYFERLGDDPHKWGKPLSALLGAYYTQITLGIPAIGGKDSMSGTFMDLTVPPTLVAFAVNVVAANKVISPEFKQPKSNVVLIPLKRQVDALPDFSLLAKNFSQVTKLITAGKVLAATSVKQGGVAEAISKMSFGNQIGMCFSKTMEPEDLFTADYGSLILEIDQTHDLAEAFGTVDYVVLGQTQAAASIKVNEIELDIVDLYQAWDKPLEKVFPTKTQSEPQTLLQPAYTTRNSRKPRVSHVKPRIFIPVFPGTNCEYDSARAFERVGGSVETCIVQNLTTKAVEQSVESMVKGINQAQIIMFPGGFSAGDEPEGSGKFIATAFRNPRIKEAVMELLQQRDGLILGICNGFQALIKLGLVPYGEIVDMSETSPTLTFNAIGHHVSCMVQTKITSVLSPWLSRVALGDIHTIPISHGEGRFVASATQVQQLIDAGQVATQYVDLTGEPSQAHAYNPNGSMYAIEAITSPDGRVLGKMGHSERIGTNVAINVPGLQDQQLFQAGIDYFR